MYHAIPFMKIEPLIPPIMPDSLKAKLVRTEKEKPFFNRNHLQLSHPGATPHSEFKQVLYY